MELHNQVALVTGGAVRIGRAISLALAGAGAGVVVHYRRSRGPALALCRRIERAGGRAWAVRGDWTDPHAPSRVVAEACRTAGRLDILINNAGVFHKHSLRQVTASRLAAEFTVNLWAPLLLMRAFAERTRWGAVVNLLDQRVRRLDTTCAPYLLAKQGMAEATRLAALEYAPGLRVNAVAPGAILPPPGGSARRVRELAGASPLQRRCTPDEVAAAVLFLLRQDALTGQVLFVDGGQHLQDY